MATCNRSEVFLACLCDFSEVDVITWNVIEHLSCADAMAMAHAWSKTLYRRAEVWCGPWQLYDNDRFEPGTLTFRGVPEAPGLYKVRFVDFGLPTEHYVFDLVKPRGT